MYVCVYSLFFLQQFSISSNPFAFLIVNRHSRILLFEESRTYMAVWAHSTSAPPYTNLNTSVVTFTPFATFSQDVKEVSCLSIYVQDPLLSWLRSLAPSVMFPVFSLFAS